MDDFRKSLVIFKPKVVEPPKPETAIDPELLDDDGRPMPGAFQARRFIREKIASLGMQPGSAAHDAVTRNMRWLIRQEARHGLDLMFLA